MPKPPHQSSAVSSSPQTRSWVEWAPAGEPHRGVMLLALGLFSLILPPLGFWVVGLADEDLGKMAKGTMHRHDGGCTLLAALLGRVAGTLFFVWVIAGCLWMASLSWHTAG